MVALIKRVAHKILVISMITILLSFFSASSVSQAKITLEEGEFYYSGTQDAEIAWEASWWQKLIKALKNIANYLLGLMLLAMRSVVIGWIEMMEIILTALLGMETDTTAYFQNALEGKDTYSQQIVNVEKIIFNKVEVLDIDIFSDDATSTATPSSGGNNSTTPSSQQEILKVIKDSVAKWYVTLRLIVIAFMLILLIFVGIKMAIATVASEKSVYKQMLMDWVTGMIVVFTIHYMMAAIITINNNLIEALGDADTPYDIPEPYEYGDMDAQKKKTKTASQMETTLYESARTRAYSVSPVDGFTGTIIYGALVYYAWKFALIYLKRLLNIMILTIISPIIAATYAFNKTMSGGAAIFNNWLKEYIVNVILQLFHVIMYITLFSIALRLSLESLLGAGFALILLGFMSKLGSLLRQLFNVTGGTGSLFEEMTSNTSFKSLESTIRGTKDLMFGGAVGKKAMAVTARVASKPIRKGAEVAFGLGMKHKANSQRYKDRKKKKEAKIKDLYDEYNNSEAVVEKRTALENREDELFEKKLKIQDEKNEIERQLNVAKQNGDTDKVKKLNEKLDRKIEEEKQNEIDIENNKNEIDEFEANIQGEFIDYYVRSQSSFGTIKDGISDLFDPENYLDKQEVSFEEIEQKAAEMFPEYEKYQKIIENDGRTPEEAQKFKEYSQKVEKFNKMAGSLNKRRKLKEKQSTLSSENAKLTFELDGLKIQLGAAQNNNDITKVTELTKQITEKEEELNQNEIAIQQNEADLKNLENEIIDEYGDELIGDLPLNKEEMKKNVDMVFDKFDETAHKIHNEIKSNAPDETTDSEERDELVQEAYEQINDMREQAQEALTKYKLKKTKREGGADYAFWRKKKDGIGKTFLENARLENILGITGEESKIIKAEFKAAKETVTGVVSGITGLATLGINPGAGMVLLSQSLNAKAETSSRIRQMKNSPSRLKYNFKFKNFGEGSVNAISEQLEREIKFAESRMTRFNASKHPNLAARLLQNSAEAVRLGANVTSNVVTPILRPFGMAGVTFSSVFLGTSLGEGIPGAIAATMDSPQPSALNPTHYKRKVIGVDTFAQDRLNDIYQKRVRKAIKEARKELIELNTKTYEKEYKAEVKKYKQKMIDEIKEKTMDELLLEEILDSDDVIQVGDMILQLEDPDLSDIEKEFKKIEKRELESRSKTVPPNPNSQQKNKNIPKVQVDENAIHQQKVQDIAQLLEDHKDKYLQIAIFDLAMMKKVEDIGNLYIDDMDKMTIKNKIRERLERKGHLRKGELKINKIIDDKSITEEFEKMKRSRGKKSGDANKKLGERMVQKACFGYMTQNNITDPNMLQSADAKSQIQSMIQNDLMSGSSKKSRNVVNALNSGNQVKGPELPESLFGAGGDIGEALNESSKKIKRRTVSQVSASTGKRLAKAYLIERSIIRNENARKAKLERAVYTGEEEQITDEAQLKMLFLLSEIEKQNKVAYTVAGKKPKKNKKETINEVRYQQAKYDSSNTYYDDDGNNIIMPREENLNILLHGKKDIIKIING